MTHPIVFSMALTLAAASGMAAAQTTVEVARVKVVLAEPGWQARVVELGNANIDGVGATKRVGIFGSLEGHAKVFTLRDAADKPVAAMLVYATYGAARNLVYSNHCPPVAKAYVRDFTNGRLESPECVTLRGVVDGPRFMKESKWMLADAGKQVPVDVPDKALLLSGFFANNTGASIWVEALVAPEFDGLAGAKPGAEVPAGMPEAMAAWADALGESARKALRSFSGELKMPPVAFH